MLRQEGLRVRWNAYCFAVLSILLVGCAAADLPTGRHPMQFGTRSLRASHWFPRPFLHRLRGGSSGGAEKRILVVDVDGTLYTSDSGIENQIVRRIHGFAARKFELSAEESDALHREYGSTLAGLKAVHGLDDEGEDRFYDEVYRGIDYDRLFSSSKAGDETGYKHSSNLRELLLTVRSRKFIASNSPRKHVQLVLSALGLADVGWEGMLTPDMDCPPDESPVLKAPANGCSSTKTGKLTKADPEYWDVLLKLYPPKEGYVIELLDDSEKNIQVAEKVGIKGVRITADFSVEHALMSHLGAIPDPTEWKFDSIKYLRAKNKVDTVSMNSDVREVLQKEISEMNVQGRLKVVDLGAGLLSMLDPVLEMTGGHEGVEYLALETEDALFETNVKQMLERGFEQVKEIDVDGMARFYKKDMPVQVTILKKDFRELAPKLFGKIHLFVACCFVDLMDPKEFLRTLMKFSGIYSGSVVYAPITFCGSTTMSPTSASSGSVPSDALVMKAYHKSLVEIQRHFLDPDNLINLIHGFGGKVLAKGPSPWVISPSTEGDDDLPINLQDEQNRLWATMLYFFGSGTAGRMSPDWDLGGWIDRMRTLKPTITAQNIDLLFRLHDGTDLALQGETRDSHGSSSEQHLLEFVATRQVRVKDLAIQPPGNGQLLLSTMSSVVSSGTELKVFRGEFETGGQLDTTIKGMADEKMEYPLHYGYSLVGEVIQAGEDVNMDSVKGKLVFSFAPHGSHAIVDHDSAMFVPPGIPAEDACYLPAVETALSLVQDARPVVGEKIAVYGQGMIGLLVTAILSRNFGSDNVIAIEMNAERAAVSRMIGAGQVVHPVDLAQNSSVMPPIDVAIEVSGNAAALQTALDYTQPGGRVILGSWYGAKSASLRLGLDFHRSQLSIKCSQVSKLPADLSGRWDKARRFDETWKWVRLIKPSRFLSTTTVPLAEAQHAYELLDKGETLGVQFAY